jgi:hypothetical protein
VSENYYEQEIKYQEQIEILKNSESLKESILIEDRGEHLILKITDSSIVKDMNGIIHFYRASDAGEDFTLEFNPGSDGIQEISSEKTDMLLQIY